MPLVAPLNASVRRPYSPCIRQHLKGQMLNRAKDISGRYKNPDTDPRGPYVLVDITAPVMRPSLVFEWHGFLPPAGRCWRYTAARLSELESQNAIVFQSSGLPRLKRYLSDTAIQAEPEADTPKIPLTERIIRLSMRAIVNAIVKDPSELYNLEWRDLERILREVFEGLGFTTQLTRCGKDGGYDLELRISEQEVDTIFLVEVKHWIQGSKKVGKCIISSFFDIVVRKQENATGLLLSSSGFTKDVLSGRTEIEQHIVRLGDADKIVSLCQSYIKGEEGMWKPTTSLPQLLFDGTS
jgi:hypothetical protein